MIVWGLGAVLLLALLLLGLLLGLLPGQPGLGGVELIKELAQADRHTAHAVHELRVGGELVHITAHGIDAGGEPLRITHGGLELGQGLGVVERGGDVAHVAARRHRLGRGRVEVGQDRIGLAHRALQLSHQNLSPLEEQGGLLGGGIEAAGGAGHLRHDLLLIHLGQQALHQLGHAVEAGRGDTLELTAGADHHRVVAVPGPGHGGVLRQGVAGADQGHLGVAAQQGPGLHLGRGGA